LRFIIEFDGVVADIAAGLFASHQAAAKEVGWSALDRATFWRLFRTHGRGAQMLPAAKPAKLAEYQTRFDLHAESDTCIADFALVEHVSAVMTRLVALGTCHLVTLGGNVAARSRLVDQGGLLRLLSRIEPLDLDPRKRPAELRTLSAKDPRTIVICGTDALVRSTGTADLFSAGISSGPCVAARLHQAGASVVFRDLDALVSSLQTGGSELVRAGLLPRSLDAPT
jgi:phosphoglycolate phosphatase-like HAD superfamily hydrolase